MMRVLFTGGGGAGNEALCRFWGTKFELHFADASKDAFSPVLPGDRCHVIPFARDAGFVPAVAALCNRISADVLVPGVDEELPHMPRISALAQSLAILVPAPDYVETMLDKRKAMSLLLSKGIDAPRTRTLNDADDLGFPCFAKPRRGRGSRGIQVLQDREAGDAYLKLSGLDPTEVIVQELIAGQEYTVLMSADRKARLRAIVPVRVDVKRGITMRAETEANEAVLNACKEIHSSLPAAGCYNIQLFLTADGRVRPFEINPRVSTTFCLGIAAGVDPIANYFAQTDPRGLLGFREHLRIARYWHNHVWAQEPQ